MITRIGTVPIVVSDQGRALEFYRDKLGFKVVSDMDYGGGVRWITVTPPQGETELLLFDPAMSGDQAEEMKKRIGIWTGIVFLTDDIQNTYQTLSQRGVKFDAPPHQQPWGGWEAFFVDQDGNRFHLAQRK